MIALAEGGLRVLRGEEEAKLTALFIGSLRKVVNLHASTITFIK